MIDTSAKIAETLLSIKALKLNPNNPFRWSSGKLSPVYCDNRLLLSYPEERSVVLKHLVKKCKDSFSEATAICGVATAGIAMGMLLAQELNIPYAYCRPEPKKHGMKNQLEGRLSNDAKIVVFEDLISTGGSCLKVVSYLREEGYDVLGVQALVSYHLDEAQLNFKNANTRLSTLLNFSELLNLAQSKNYLQREEINMIQEWMKDPSLWSDEKD